MIIYVGDGGDIIKRIKTNHCSGNVEGSAFRRIVARSKGFVLSSEQRPSGSARVRINSENPLRDEAVVSDYIKSGSWRVVECATSDEARDFQWFAIDRLQPACNVAAKPWDSRRAKRYDKLLRELLAAPALSFVEVRSSSLKSPGVYMFEHVHRPDA